MSATPPQRRPFPQLLAPTWISFKVVDLPWRCWWRSSAAAVNRGENWMKTCCLCCNLGSIFVVWAIWEIRSSYSVQEEECLLERSKQTKQHELDSKVLDEAMDIYHQCTFCAVSWIAGIAKRQERESVRLWHRFERMVWLLANSLLSVLRSHTDASSAGKATKLVQIGAVRSFWTPCYLPRWVHGCPELQMSVSKQWSHRFAVSSERLS